MEKFDWKTSYPDLFSVKKSEPRLVEVPSFTVITIDGKGNPNTAAAFAEANEALFSVSYGIKFALKKHGSLPDFSVSVLEGLWWADDMDDFMNAEMDSWKWRLFIAQPPFVQESHFEDARTAAAKKGKGGRSLDLLRFETFDEGRVAQIVHFGPYSAEAPTVAALHRFIAEHGLNPRGLHHEIYLSDPTRSAPEKMKAIIRQPVE